MITSLALFCIILVLVAGVRGSHRDPECPRRRGLPDGFVRAKNRFKERAVFRLDVRNALKGYTPSYEYRFRVQTTIRKFKFNDATVVIDPLDRNCGAGSWNIESDLLYSPKDCPTVVTTQQKQPMGRAHFIWRAPSCGCVHFRVRVHVNSTYYLEDETVHNGPLAQTVCPKPGTVVEPVKPKTTTEQTHTHLPLSREERLSLLCDVTQAHEHSDVIQYGYFMTRRQVTNLNQFELDRLSTAVQRRHLDVLNCCDKNDIQPRMDCFGDIRRISIDSFCGYGEADIPLARDTYDWIKQKELECCPQIGEQRYECFNQTLHDTEMMRDGHDKYSLEDLDDFDPVNFLEDYPAAGDMREKFIEKKTKSKHVELIRHTTDKSKTDTELKKSKTVRRNGIVTEDASEEEVDGTNLDNKVQDHAKHTSASPDSGRDDDDDDNDDKHHAKDDKDDNDSDKDDDDDDSDDDDKKGLVSDDESSGQDPSRERVLSREECCRNGIDAGTRVFTMGFDGCFKMANRYQAYFTKWGRKCDLSFVVCCMRVIDGGSFKEDDIKSINTHGLWNTIRNYACIMKHINQTLKYRFDSKNRKTAKLKRLIRKQLKHKSQNLTIKSKFYEKDKEGTLFRLNHNVTDIDNRFKNRKNTQNPGLFAKSLIKLENESKYEKWKRKRKAYRKRNTVFKTLESLQ